MKITIPVLIVVLCSATQQRMVTGVVMSDDTPAYGAIVNIAETGITQKTSHNGRFELAVPGELNKFTLIIRYPEYAGTAMCKTKIENVLMNEALLHLDTIPITFNETIGVIEYEKLGPAKKEDYQSIYHYNRLIGYMHKNRIDTAEMKTKLEKKNVKGRYDSLENTIVIDYKDLLR